MVYILHFSEPIHHARHYTGYCRKIGPRLAAHRMGQGARLTQVAVERGISLVLVYLEPGSRIEERRLKRSHNIPRICPICNGQGWPGYNEWVSRA
jgi:predicted GIY-YIG superfamily endonuclease